MKALFAIVVIWAWGSVVWAKVPPPEWKCKPEYYNDGNGCDCNCGAYDPDCDDPLQPVYNCNPDEVCSTEGTCCRPDCTGKECGDDGCGRSCGTCGEDQTCYQGMCCTPDCTEKECGGDGCGGSCGECPEHYACVDGKCQCQPDCAGKECGDDGCGGSCGSCPANRECVKGRCVGGNVPPEWRCGEDSYFAGDGCDCECGAYDPDCDDPTSKVKNCGPGEVCTHTGHCCKPECDGKECGDDGCGGSCGECGEGQHCEDGKCVEGCVPDCKGKECGDDGCGGVCGICGHGKVCKDGRCVEGVADEESELDVPSGEEVSEPEETMEVLEEQTQVEEEQKEERETSVPSCPDGMVYKYNGCYPIEGGEKQKPTSSGGGCTINLSPTRGEALGVITLLLFLLLLMKSPFSSSE